MIANPISLVAGRPEASRKRGNDPNNERNVVPNAVIRLPPARPSTGAKACLTWTIVPLRPPSRMGNEALRTAAGVSVDTIYEVKINALCLETTEAHQSWFKAEKE